MKIAWVLRVLETGDYNQDVVDVGWEGKNPQWKAAQWKKEFSEVLGQAVKFRRSWSEIKALVVLDVAMEMGIDPAFNKDPRVMSNAIKAVGEGVDRGDMPRGTAMKGLDTAPGGGKAVASADEMIDRRVVVEVEHPKLGTVKQIGIPIKLSDTPGAIRSLGTTLGADTDEILARFGYTPDEVASLRKEEVAG